MCDPASFIWEQSTRIFQWKFRFRDWSELVLDISGIDIAWKVYFQKSGCLKSLELFIFMTWSSLSFHLRSDQSGTNQRCGKVSSWTVEQLCANLLQKWKLPKSKFHQRRQCSARVRVILIDFAKFNRNPSSSAPGDFNLISWLDLTLPPDKFSMRFRDRVFNIWNRISSHFHGGQYLDLVPGWQNQRH